MKFTLNKKTYNYESDCGCFIITQEYQFHQGRNPDRCWVLYENGRKVSMSYKLAYMKRAAARKRLD